MQMIITNLFYEIIHRIKNYNVFIKEENDYEEDEQIDQNMIIKQQKYTTWLYTFLLLSKIHF